MLSLVLMATAILALYEGSLEVATIAVILAAAAAAAKPPRWRRTINPKPPLGGKRSREDD